jgi:hypothetical protein
MIYLIPGLIHIYAVYITSYIVILSCILATRLSEKSATTGGVRQRAADTFSTNRDHKAQTSPR